MRNTNFLSYIRKSDRKLTLCKTAPQPISWAGNCHPPTPSYIKQIREGAQAFFIYRLFAFRHGKVFIMEIEKRPAFYNIMTIT